MSIRGLHELAVGTTPVSQEALIVPANELNQTSIPVVMVGEMVAQYLRR
jgi:hypothetical protein